MSHAGHEKVVCQCGRVVRQCRCVSPDKTVTIVPQCPSCVAVRLPSVTPGGLAITCNGQAKQ